MRAEVYAHASAHDDVDGAVSGCLEYCDLHGWKRPNPMVTRHDDLLSPDLGVALLSGTDVLIVPHVSDLLYAGVDLARLKSGRRLTFAEEKVAAIREMREAIRRLLERGATLCIVEGDLRLSGDDGQRFADMLGAIADSVSEWNREDRDRRSERSRDSIAKARAQGARIGRPRKSG